MNGVKLAYQLHKHLYATTNGCLTNDNNKLNENNTPLLIRGYSLDGCTACLHTLYTLVNNSNKSNNKHSFVKSLLKMFEDVGCCCVRLVVMLWEK